VTEKQDIKKCNNETISILVVDDDPDILFATTRLLRSAGYIVFEANNGTACLKAAYEKVPDLVLLDVHLPDIMGHEVCRQIKANKEMLHSYVVMISGKKISPDNQSEGLEIGADGYLTRPISNRELLAHVQAVGRIITAERELKQLKAKLEIQSEKRHLSILKTAMDGFWITDTQGRLLEVNESYCKMTGYRENELLTMSISDLEVVENPSEVAIHMQKILEQGFDRFESKHRRKDGTTFDVEVSVQSRNDDGRCVCFLRDISGNKQSEKALHRKQAMLIRTEKIA
jgi:PAS domain S-box-containing protein